MPLSYSLLLSETPITISPKMERTKTILLQAQGADVCYRFGAGCSAVDGFILAMNSFLTVAPPLTVWAFGLEARIVIQEMA